MAAEVGYLPRDPGSAAEDRRIAALAAVDRRRAGTCAPTRSRGRELGLVVLTGGVFRQRDPPAGWPRWSSTLRADPVLAPALGGVPDAGGRRLRGAAGRPAGRRAAATAAAEALLRDQLLG